MEVLVGLVVIVVAGYLIVKGYQAYKKAQE